MSSLQFFTLSNRRGMQVTLTNFGARLTSVLYPVNGRPTEMIVAYQNPQNFLSDPFYLGATCGRVCNRIANAKFTLANKIYHLPNNDNGNCLHGGVENFSVRFWQELEQFTTNQSVTLQLHSFDGDQGFPGNLTITQRVSLDDNGNIEINYNAVTTHATPINITNHAYFNLGETNCLGLDVSIASPAYLERTNNNTPTGKLVATNQEDFNFRKSKNLGLQQKNGDEKLQAMKGYDHCFILDNSPLTEAKAELISTQNNVKMTLFTDQAAVQLYTGAYLSGEFQPYQGVCLEAQNFTDAVNFAHFPSSILEPNQQYNRTIIYQFSQL